MNTNVNQEHNDKLDNNINKEPQNIENISMFSDMITKQGIFIARALNRGGIFEILFGMIIMILGMSSILFHYDVLYFPPFLIFTMRYYYFWTTVGVSFIILGLSSMIYNYSYKRKIMSKIRQIIVKIFATSQLFVVPFGTYFAIIVLKGMKQIESMKHTENKKNQERRNNNYKNEIIKKTEWKFNGDNRIILERLMDLLIAGGFFSIAVLTTTYILTIYLSTMMLDLTFPYLTISTIYKVRMYLYFFIFIFLISLIGSVLIKKNKNIIPESLWIKIYLLIHTIIYFPLIPIGTYISISTIKGIRYLS